MALSAFSCSTKGPTFTFSSRLPPPDGGPPYDVVFIGNWGDDDRATAMRRYLFEVAAALPRRRFLLHGVRYTPEVLATLARSGIRYGGWVANTATPAVYATARLAVHIPRQPYLDLLPGTPTIRVFEVLACGRSPDLACPGRTPIACLLRGPGLSGGPLAGPDERTDRAVVQTTMHAARPSPTMAWPRCGRTIPVPIAPPSLSRLWPHAGWVTTPPARPARLPNSDLLERTP